MNWASTLSGTSRRTLMGAGVGAGLGGLYGAMSDNTSVLGGALTGAGVGAIGARYLGAGFRTAAGAGRGMGLRASAGDYGKRFGMGVAARARLDYRGARLAANQAVNGFTGMFRGIGGSMG